MEADINGLADAAQDRSIKIMPTKEMREKHERRIAHAALGLCIYCTNPQGTRLDGTTSLRCDEHNAERSKARRSSASKPEQKRPVVPRIAPDEWGVFESNGHLDTPEFQTYCEHVERAIKVLGEPNVAEIKRFLPELDHRFFFDAIAALVGSIKQTREVSPLRWMHRLSPAPIREPFGGAMYLTPPASLSQPDPASFAGREVRA